MSRPGDTYSIVRLYGWEYCCSCFAFLKGKTMKTPNAVRRFTSFLSVCALLAIMPMVAHADNDRHSYDRSHDRSHDRSPGRSSGRPETHEDSRRVTSGNFERIQTMHAQRNHVVNVPVQNMRAYGHSRPQQIVRYAPPRPVYAPHYYAQYHPHHPYIGRRLVYYSPVPTYMIGYLQPAPRGYYYSMADQNIFLVSGYDNTIVQIISMLLR